MRTPPTKPAFVVDRTTPRSMRRRSPLVLVGALLIALAAWLAGRGLGWIGKGIAAATPAPATTATPGTSAPPDAGPTPDAAPGVSQSGTKQSGANPTGTNPSGVTSGATSGANPSGPGQAVPPEANPVAAPPSVSAPGPAPALRSARETVDEDRFASRVSLLRARLAEGAFGQAEAVRQQLLAWDLDTSQRLRLLADADALSLAVDAALVRLGDHLDGGRILAAREQLRRLVGEGEPAVQAWLSGLLRAAGVPPELATGTSAPGAAPPKPLARGRVVRWRRGSSELTGEVADSSAATVTVRVSSGETVAFPTLALPEVEPVDPTAAEAVEMGLAALAAGDGALARLWLCFARRRAPGGLGERGEQLIRHLP